jgi:hypothetical protein
MKIFAREVNFEIRLHVEVTFPAAIDGVMPDFLALNALDPVERGDPERPTSRRFGALVHALLASIDLDAGVDHDKGRSGYQWTTRGRLQRRKSRLPLPRSARR